MSDWYEFDFKNYIITIPMCYHFNYHPYYKGTNSYFNEDSKIILNFKNGDTKAINIAIELLEERYQDNCLYVAVPSHDSQKKTLSYA